MFKKIITFSTCLCFLFGISGCSRSMATTSGTTISTEVETYQTGVETRQTEVETTALLDLLPKVTESEETEPLIIDEEVPCVLLYPLPESSCLYVDTITSMVYVATSDFYWGYWHEENPQHYMSPYFSADGVQYKYNLRENKLAEPNGDNATYLYEVAFRKIETSNVLYYDTNTKIIYILSHDSEVNWGDDLENGYMSPYYSKNGRLCIYNENKNTLSEVSK